MKGKKVKNEMKKDNTNDKHKKKKQTTTSFNSPDNNGLDYLQKHNVDLFSGLGVNPFTPKGSIRPSLFEGIKVFSLLKEFVKCVV